MAIERQSERLVFIFTSSQVIYSYQSVSHIGRHAISVTPDTNNDARFLTPPPTNTFSGAMRGIWGMFTTYPYWDVSYLVAIIFTLGSLCWCFNAFFVWLPLQDPSTEFNNEISVAGGVTAFIGATIFEVGSVLLMIEAVNENRSDCFGWALQEALEEKGLMRLRPDHDHCAHHHSNKGNFVGKGKASVGTLAHSYICLQSQSMLYCFLYRLIPC